MRLQRPVVEMVNIENLVKILASSQRNDSDITLELINACLSLKWPKGPGLEPWNVHKTHL